MRAVVINLSFWLEASFGFRTQIDVALSFDGEREVAFGCDVAGSFTFGFGNEREVALSVNTG